MTPRPTCGSIAGALFLVASAIPVLAEDRDETAQRIEEIVVTARRRPESLQKSSLVIEVLSPEELDRAAVTQAKDLNALVPGLQIGREGGITQTYLRGVGDYSGNGFAQTGVAFNVDGVYVSRPEAINTDFYDLERVEILKGPQGTLYGRNTTGGAVNLVTGRPERERSGYVGADLGSFDLRRFAGGFNTPLTETLAARAALQIVERDGYLSDGYDDEESQAGRLRALWEPAPRVSLLVSAAFAHLGGKGGGAAVLPRQGDPWLGPSSPEVSAFIDRQPLFGVPGGGALIEDTGRDGFVDSNFGNASAELVWDLDFATLTVLPAYRDVDSAYRSYGLGLPTFLTNDSRQTTVEARLARALAWLDSVGGVYWFREDQDVFLEVNAGDPFVLHSRSRVPNLETEAAAVFGEGTARLAERLRLIAGARYTHEERSGSGRYDYVTAAPLFPQTDFDYGGDLSDDAVTWKTGLEADVAERSMLFFTAATGFKSGGFFQARDTPDFPNTFEPERLTAFELGSRNQFLDDRLRVNVEAFWWEYRDQQVAHLGTDADGNLNFLTVNAGEATLRGVDLDVASLVTDYDEFRFGIEYLDTRYGEFAYDQPTGFANTGCRVTTTGPPVPLVGVDTIDCSGFPLSRAAEWSGWATIEHAFDLGAYGRLGARLDLRFATERWLSVDYLPNGRDDAYVTENVSLDWVSADGRWSAGAWVRNLSDEATYSGAFPALTPNVLWATINAPRTFGGGVRASF